MLSKLVKVFKALFLTQKTATKCVIIAAGQTYHPKKNKLHCSLVNWLFLQKPVKRVKNQQILGLWTGPIISHWPLALGTLSIERYGDNLYNVRIAARF